MQSITFFVGSTEEDALWSRVGDQVRFSSISYKPYYEYPPLMEAYECAVSTQKYSIFHSALFFQEGKGRWTKKVPVEWKNAHRQAWGLPPLKEEKVLAEWYIDWDHIYAPTPENVDPFPPALEEWLASCPYSPIRRHWYGNREYFKTWVFTAPLAVVRDEVAPLLEGARFIAKIKCW